MRYSAWKYIPFLVVFSINRVDAQPSVSPEQPALQIAATKVVTSNDQAMIAQAESRLTSEKVATLAGGISFLLDVDMSKVIAQQMATLFTDLERQLRDNKLKFNSLSHRHDTITLKFAHPQDLSVAASFLMTNMANQFNVLPLITKNGPILKLTYKETEIQQIQSDILNQNMMSLRNRIKALGISESMVRPQANNRIEVKLIGVQDPMFIKPLLARPLALEFRMVSDLNDQIIDPSTGQMTGTSTPETEIFALDSLDSGKYILLDRTHLLTDEHIQSISTNHEQPSGLALVSVNLNSTGTKLMIDATRTAIGKRMAILLIENKLRMTSIADPETGEMIATPMPYTESVVISAATINDVLGSRFNINAKSIEEANKLALLLRSGRFAAPMSLIETRIMEPSTRQ